MFGTNPVCFAAPREEEEPFVALVDSIEDSESSLKVIFKRCTETIFPSDKDGATNELLPIFIEQLIAVEPYT